MELRVKEPVIKFRMNSPRQTGLLLIASGAILTLLAGFWIYRPFGPHPERLVSEKSSPSSTDRPASLDYPDTAHPGLSSIASSIDFQLWSEKRIAAYNETLSHHFDSPVALLEIEKIHLEVPVFNGTDEPMLNRGVGRIIGTARPGERGNMGIAGHRDGFFRALK